MINNKHNFIFIHVPKTGGTSIEHFFGGWKEYSHENLEFYLNKNKNSKKYFKFGFVRNPWARMVSEYKWLTNTNLNVPGEKAKRFWKDKSFKDFCKLFFEPKYCKLADKRHAIPQLDFFNPIDSMDFIGRFESFQKDFDIVCKKLKIKDSKLEHRMKTIKSKHYSEYYDDESRNIVKEKYQKDIDFFGYTFES